METKLKREENIMEIKILPSGGFSKKTELTKFFFFVRLNELTNLVYEKVRDEYLLRFDSANISSNWTLTRSCARW